MSKRYSTFVFAVLFCGCQSATHQGETAGSRPSSRDMAEEKSYPIPSDPAEADIYAVLSRKHNPYSNTIASKGKWALATITTLYGREERDVRQSPTTYVILNKVDGHWVILEENQKALTIKDLTSHGISRVDAEFLISSLKQASNNSK